MGRSPSLAVPPSLAQGRAGQRECWLWHRRPERGPHRELLRAAGQEQPLHLASGSLNPNPCDRQGAEGLHKPAEKRRPGVSRPEITPVGTPMCVTPRQAWIFDKDLPST